jgi:hypothetical protein
MLAQLLAPPKRRRLRVRLVTRCIIEPDFDFDDLLRT